MQDNKQLNSNNLIITLIINSQIVLEVVKIKVKVVMVLS